MAEYPTLPDLMRVYFRDSVEEIKEALKNLTEVSVDTGIADVTSTVNQLDDASKSWPVNAFQNLIVEITKGTGAGDLKKIASNTATALLPATPWAVAPDATSEYRVAFYGKMASDITHWGGTALTGRDVSADLQALTDASITGILKSLGDVGAGDNIATILAALETVLGLTGDIAVAAGAAGTISAKLRSLSRDLVANIVLATGSNVIGGVTIADGSDATQGAIADLAVAAGAAGTAAAKLRRLTTDLAAVMTAVQTIAGWDATHDALVSEEGPQIMIEATEFTGSQFPRSVHEADAARPVGSLHRVLYMMPTSKDGAQTPYDEIENVFKMIEQANARQQSITVEVQSATVITAAETIIGGPIIGLGFNTIAFWEDYTNGDETSYDLIFKFLRITGGDVHPSGAWSVGGTRTWTEEIFRLTASKKVPIVFNITGINLIEVYGDATGGTPTGTCQLGYTLTNN